MEDLRYNCSRYLKAYYCSISINQFKEMKAESLIFITHLEQELIRESSAKSLSNHNSLEHSNLEEQIASWLDSHGVNDGWKPPQTLAAAKSDTQGLDTISKVAPLNLFQISYLGWMLDFRLRIN
jgi:hypothetical protein